MKRFSVAFGLKKVQAELDFVDIDLDSDTPLYVDPYALTTREDDWSQRCQSILLSFFQAVLSAVMANDERRGTHLLSHLGEPEETRLGVSKKGNPGRGIGTVQAAEIFAALARSNAAKSGLLQDISDFALFVPHVGRDKISDMTTNIIRGALIDYTQTQCRLHGIAMQTVATGMFWDSDGLRWDQNYRELPVYLNCKLLLVPKFAVRYSVGVDAASFRRSFVLDFLREEHLRADDSLVTAIRDKAGNVTKKIVYKKTIDEHYPKDKEFLAEFSMAHPEVIEDYRNTLKAASCEIPNIGPNRLDEGDLADHLASRLSAIPTGRDHADDYHSLMVGIVSFLFFPNLIYPKKEAPINDGRKRIDITYTNGKESGIFYRLALDADVKANIVHVECKNYSSDIANPEFDQLLGRFDFSRGKLGLILFRATENRKVIIQRCRDAAKSGLGIILPLDDQFLLTALKAISENKREKIDESLDRLLREILS